jgi:2-methylcitrate dehydratase PrpD
MNETRTLARFVAQTRFDDLPASVVDDCKLTVLDTFAAGFVGAVQPWAQRIVAVVRALGGPPDATVIHQDWRTDVSRAALANGVLIGAFECEPLTGSHASGTVLPAVLAMGQHEHVSGAAFLTAMAVGFEVSARLARAATGLETVRGFHNPGTQGPFGAAAAVGKLCGLDDERLVSALGIAGSGSAGLLEFAWSGGDTKRLHLGRPASSGWKARCSRGAE